MSTCDKIGDAVKTDSGLGLGCATQLLYQYSPCKTQEMHFDFYCFHAYMALDLIHCNVVLHLGVGAGKC